MAETTGKTRTTGKPAAKATARPAAKATAAKGTGKGRAAGTGEAKAATKAAGAPKADKAPKAAKARKPAAAAGKKDASGGAARVRLQEISERIATRLGIRKSKVRPVIEATFRTLADALDAGERLVLPHLGKLRVSRSKATPKGAAMTVKVKRKPAAKAAGDSGGGLADDGDRG